MATGFPLLDDVIQKWESRGIITHEQAKYISARAQKEAFHLVGEWSDEAVKSIKDLVQRTFDNGGIGEAGLSDKEFDELARGVSSRFEDGWYRDLVIRNNVHSAQMEGRREEMFSKEWATAAPFWQFRCVHDTRNDDDEKCPNMICRTLDGAVFAKSDGGAMKFWPALHHACRCLVVELDRAGMKRLGLTVSTLADFPGLEPQEGFGYAA